MAWRIDEVVVRGEIDNTVEGRTTGTVWLAGRERPLLLELDGDCWRDLAGARLAFVNPNPMVEDTDELVEIQRGVVGDITASQKAQVLLVSEEEAERREEAGREVPTVWKNTLYLEWFSHENGRVLLETTEYDLTVSEHVWTMEPETEGAQKLANLQAMRDAMSEVIQRLPSVKRSRPTDDDDEFVWEERLKESDRLTDAYQEVLEKYLDDPSAEQKEAFVMGWDGLLETLADKAEGKEPSSKGWSRISEQGDDDWEEEDEDDELFRQHPLQERSQELALRAMDICREENLENSPAADLLASSLLQITGKLAGALNGDYERETGYVLAILKRCLSWHNDALAACAELIAQAKNAEQRTTLKSLESSIFEIREAIVNLRTKLKAN
jgi:hypothetical protein